MPRYDVRNDGVGPYAVFYCESCEREFRSQPDVKNTIVNDIGRKAAGDLLRKVPIFGGELARNVAGEDPRYVYNLTPAQLQAHWEQVKEHFRECPTCGKVVCLSDFDTQSDTCNEDSPRTNEINQARGEQAGAALKGLASAFGLGESLNQMGNAMRQAGRAAEQASASMARCPNDGTLAAAGTKFCPECGSPMKQPEATLCPKCGTDVKGAKFCPECGTKIEAKPTGICAQCGTDTKGAKFCPECGAKQ
jgi:ribosomal protein L32